MASVTFQSLAFFLSIKFLFQGLNHGPSFPNSYIPQLLSPDYLFASWKNFQEVTYPNIAPRKSSSTLSFMSWAPKRKIHLVVMSSINHNFYALIVSYIYSFEIPLIRVRDCVPSPRSQESHLICVFSLYRRSLSVLIDSECYMPTISCLVRPQATP